MEPINISVIIPSYNPDPAKLIECLKAIRSSSLSPLEVILVDDGSTKSYPAETVSYCRIIKRETNNGPASVRNIGASEAKGNILCFIDADVKIERTTLAQISEKFGSENIAAVQTIYSTFTPIPNFISQYQNMYLHYNFVSVKGNYLCTLAAHCIAIRKDIFTSVNGFDEDVKHASVEDENLGLRLYFSGHKILLAKDITVQHMDYIDFKRIIKRMFYMGSDRVESFLKTPKTRGIDISKTHHPLSLILSIFISPIFFLSALPGIPFMKAVTLLSSLFLLVNFGFFSFLYKNRGIVFTLRSIAMFYLVCLIITLGCINGVKNRIL